MTVRSAMLCLLLYMLPFTVFCTPPPPAQVEIEYLLSYVETSNCSFYRNGSWYDGARAKAHLRAKYDYMSARSLIASAEDFIDRGATKSSFSGRPYKIKCGTGPEVECGPWLHEVLLRYRASARNRSPDVTPHEPGAGVPP